MTNTNLNETARTPLFTPVRDEQPLPDACELLGYLDAGMDLIELHEWNAKTSDGEELGKVPKTNGWTRKRCVGHKMIDHMDLGYNVGVRLRECDLVLDYDPRRDKKGTSLKRFADDVGLNVDSCPIVMTGGGGKHVYLRKPEDVAVLGVLKAYPGLEFKSKGSQVVAAGSIHPEGKPYEWDVIAGDLSNPVDAPEALIEAIRRAERKFEPGESGVLRPELLEMALSGLDPCNFRDHEQWLNIMMACHHATDGNGRDGFVAWSTSDPEYAGHTEKIWQRWDSLSADDNPTPITVGTLYRFLIDAGRRDVVRRLKALVDFEDEPLDEALSSASPNRAWGDEDPIEYVNKSYFTITKDRGYAVGRVERDRIWDSEETQFFNESAIRKDLDRWQVPQMIDGKEKMIGLGKYWLGHPERRHFRHVTFDPNPQFDDPDTWNLFRGFAVQPDRAADWGAYRDFILNVIAGGDANSNEYILNWAAAMVQRPHQQAGTMLVLQGDKGSGKGTLGRGLAGLVQPHAVHISQPDQLTGKFNAHFARKICAFVDEGHWSGDRKATNALKAIITEPTLMCEPKGVDAFQIPNMLHIVLATNDDWAAPADADDRRYAAFSPRNEDVAEFKRSVGFGSVLEENGAVSRQMLEGMMVHLLERDIEGWRADQNIPETDALKRQRLLTTQRDPLPAWWQSVLQWGGVACGCENFTVWREVELHAGPDMKDELACDCAEFVRSLPYRCREFDKATIAKWLVKTFGYDITSNIMENKKRRKGWIIPRLDQARHDFEIKFKTGPIDWEAGE